MAPIPLVVLPIFVLCLVFDLFLGITFLFVFSRVPGSYRVHAWLDAQLWRWGNAFMNAVKSWRRWTIVAQHTQVWQVRIRPNLITSWWAQIAVTLLLIPFGNRTGWLIASLVFWIVPTMLIGYRIPKLRKQVRDVLITEATLWKTGEPKSSLPDYKKFFDHPIA